MSTTVSANAATSKVITLHDVAAAAGVSYGVACSCLKGSLSARYSKDTQKKVLSVAKALGYDHNTSRRAQAQYATSVSTFKRQNRPANPVFDSKTSETTAMIKLRSEGCSNPEIARRCGVSIRTVHNRIGDQPDEITAANKKLAGKVRAAKNQIKKNHQSQQLVSAYNTKVEELNAEMAKVKQMASEIESMQKSAAKASKATGTPLLRLLPPTKIS